MFVASQVKMCKYIVLFISLIQISSEIIQLVLKLSLDYFETMKCAYKISNSNVLTIVKHFKQSIFKFY